MIAVLYETRIKKNKGVSDPVEPLTPLFFFIRLAPGFRRGGNPVRGGIGSKTDALYPNRFPLKESHAFAPNG
jgi:hypothetical protein